MNAVIAVNPQQMQEAQTTTIAWVDVKLADAKRELSVAEQVFNSLHANKLRTQPAQTQIRKARNRISFYEKVKAALSAGYYIIPPFPVQVFAIRTDRGPSDYINSNPTANNEAARSLPVGEGEYYDPRPAREWDHAATKKKTDGTTYEVDIYRNTEFKDVELPIRAFKPQVIEATGKALALKIFDALGILPAWRAADPMIVGHIKRPVRYSEPLTFFVAWWLDERDL